MRKRATLVVLSMLAVLFPTVAATATAGASQHAQPATYRATLTNTTDGQWLTPPNWAAHSGAVDVFQVGRPASPGVQAVAENGGVPVLAAELEGAVDSAGLGISGVGADAPIPPGASVTFEFTTDQYKFSLVSMIICTNDGFAGLDARNLPFRDGQTRHYNVRDYDAGTEINTELRADIVPAPFCGDGGGTGESNPALAEDGVIKRHRTLRGVGDLPDSFDWPRGDVASLSITRVPAERSYDITVENITSGQYLTPPNFALHSRDVDVFQKGQPASPGVQAVAENGGVPILAAELQAAIDNAGFGVSGVGGEGPLAPGESVNFSVSSLENRLSIVSMVVCTNDGFAGLDSKGLPRWVGDTRTFYVRALDAGTEINTELRADIVPAPFCGEGGGTGESNPALAEDGVIKNHRTLRGVGDLPDKFDWRGPVMKVTVTRNA